MTTRTCNFVALKNGPVVRQLVRSVAPVSGRNRCLAVLDRFIADPQLIAVAVVDRQQKPIGIVDRKRLVETFIKPYSRELHLKTSIKEFLEPDPIVVEAATTLDDLAQIIIDAGMRHMVSGFIVTENGQYLGMGTGHDLLQEITARRQAHLYSLAHFDHLTGLPNRLLFHDRLSQACLNARRTGSELALIFIDLDRFKSVNDSLGHAFGDMLLQAVTQRLLDAVRENDTVSRLSGDEFTVILEALETPDAYVQVAERIVSALGRPILLRDKEVHVSASVGVALCPRHERHPEALLRQADAAMYLAKQRGRNCFQVFGEDLEDTSATSASLEAELRRAIQNGELVLHFQPQVDFERGTITGAEALVRWRHPTQGLIYPKRFIQMAEDSGLIVPLGEWVVREACNQLARWNQEGLSGFRISVNISPQHFRHPSFYEGVSQSLAETAVSPSRLELELTESGLMWDGERSVRLVSELRQLGLTLALDDFGTGYSSLHYLHKFQIDRLKIDQSFVRDIDTTPTNQAIVKAIAAVGESLGLAVVAEGVESAEELSHLAEQSCREVQGYYFSHPLDETAFKTWYAEFGTRQLARVH